MKTRILAVAAATAMASGAAQAASFGTFDARSMGMGGIGTSAGNASNASFYNPALLGGSVSTDLFGVEVPMITARIADPEDLMEAAEDLSDSADTFDEKLQAFNDNESPENAKEASTAISNFSSALQGIGGKPLEIDIFGGALVGVATDSIGVSLYGSARAMGGFRFDIDEDDTGYLNDYSSDLTEINTFYEYVEDGNPQGYCSGTCNDTTDLQNELNGNLETLNINNISGTLADPELEMDSEERDELASKLSARGAVIQDIGVSLARDFTIKGMPVSFGITPKMLSVDTFDYSVSAENEDFEVDEGTKEHSAFDVDLGVARMWDIGGHDVRTGLMIKNLMNHSFKTALGNTIDLKPQMRVGVSHHTRFSTLGLDLDLLENTAMADGFDQPTQYLGLGGELNAWRTLLLRVGYRTDLAGSYEDTIHAGIGLFNLVDIGAAMSDDEYQVSARLGFRW